MPVEKIMVIGNCLAMALATACRCYFSEIEVVNLHLWVNDITGKFLAEANSCDLIFAQTGLEKGVYPSEFSGIVEDFAARFPLKVRRYPRIVFTGFHPDCVYALDRTGSGLLSGAFAYHSAIALAAFRRGHTIDKTVALFNKGNLRCSWLLRLL